MTMFLVYMNMPSSSGNAVHLMTVSHAAESLEEFVKELQDNDFVIVTEFYSKGDNKFEKKHDVAINYRHIGKVRLMDNFVDKRTV